jgi:hypothetical protein
LNWPEFAVSDRSLNKFRRRVRPKSYGFARSDNALSYGSVKTWIEWNVHDYAAAASWQKRMP